MLPGLGSNLGVLGFVRGFLALVVYALIAGAATVATILVSQYFHGIWVPLAFGAVFGLLTGFWPPMRGVAFRGGYALLAASATLLGWASSQPPVPQSRHLWLWASVTLLVGLGLFVVGYLRAKRPLAMLWLLLLVAEATGVGHFSGSVASAGNMVRWLEAVLHLDASLVNAIIVPLRKTIHFGFYGLVGFTALQVARGAKRVRWEAYGTAVAFALAYGSFDEMRQWYAPGRGSSIYDVMLDTTGAAVVCALIVWRSKR